MSTQIKEVANKMTIGESAAMISTSAHQDPHFSEAWRAIDGEVELVKEFACLAILSAELYEASVSAVKAEETGVYLYEVDAELGRFFADQVRKGDYDQNASRLELGRLVTEYFGSTPENLASVLPIVHKLTGYAPTMH